ncbi:CRISPR-associated endonuclease Cas2 [Rhabdaerophilum sp. SD176]|uniref:CRISPR-associated endonuclease Cas2 n=1 Tax=Rhabdaerophilum sp. SD176 TaxID=2983548 RepID=UPI0024DFE04B|nr:CRISPR-associated endonuclease Cas2 [Rhabdaerophilum sp. SD176]
MSTEHAFVFCYDVSGDRARAKIAEMLEKHLVRVQKSVFEGRMTHRKAQKIAESISVQLGPGDSLRIYALTNQALDLSFSVGGAPMPEKNNFLLF